MLNQFVLVGKLLEIKESSFNDSIVLVADKITFLSSKVKTGSVYDERVLYS